MSRRKMPRVNFNIIAAAVIAGVIIATLIGLEWRPASPMDGLLDQLQAQLLDEDWDAAATTLKTVHEQWQSRLKWLALNQSRNAIVRFEQQLARVRAGIDVRDLSSAAVDAEELTEMWNEFAG